MINIILAAIIIATPGLRQANYDEVNESAVALGIRVEDVGFWPSRSEIKELEKLVDEEIEKLVQKAERAEIDIKEVTKEAKTQAEAIYLVQDELDENNTFGVDVRKNKQYPKINKLAHVIVPLI